MLRRFMTTHLSTAASNAAARSPGSNSARSAASAGLTSHTELEITTMSYIAKPRLSIVRLGELSPTKKRLGIVNYTRDTTADNKRRKWYMFPAVADFSIQESSNTMPKVPWVWSKIANRIASLPK